MLTLVSSIFGAISGGFKAFLAVFSAKNTPAMQANAAGQTAAKTADKVAGDVSAAVAGNPSSLESDLAE